MYFQCAALNSEARRILSLIFVKTYKPHELFLHGDVGDGSPTTVVLEPEFLEDELLPSSDDDEAPESVSVDSAEAADDVVEVVPVTAVAVPDGLTDVEDIVAAVDCVVVAAKVVVAVVASSVGEAESVRSTASDDMAIVVGAAVIAVGVVESSSESPSRRTIYRAFPRGPNWIGETTERSLHSTDRGCYQTGLLQILRLFRSWPAPAYAGRISSGKFSPRFPGKTSLTDLSLIRVDVIVARVVRRFPLE
ncbi:uncharacterized protein V1510DRAFT_406849 [Dipodascopsis tothii]|uniref:uncharacterized protein n=1 Tax=Dipodascopsis tothii TaxID=44089 RepID=UPI0034CFECD7